MKKLLHFFIIFGVIILLPMLICAQSISITDISPDSPTRLSFNQQVSVHFTYSIPSGNAAQIFIRPITSGNLTPNYAASGSPVYSPGRGQGNATFTITSGNTSVDQLRVQVLNANQNRMIFEFFVPVKFTFGTPILTFNPAIKAKVLHSAGNKNLTQIRPDTSKGNQTIKNSAVVKRTVKTDGTIEIHYSDGLKYLPHQETDLL